MPRSTPHTQPGPNRRFLSSHATVAATTTQLPTNFFALPLELRIAIYKLLFGMTDKCTLRPLKDHPNATRNIKLFDTSILTTCRAIYTEALPLFYANQPFHYSTERNGLFRQPAIPKPYLQWVNHLSIDATITMDSYPNTDALIATHVRSIIKHCPKLSTFTLHIIPGSNNLTRHNMPLSLTPPCDTPGEMGETAKALRALHPRLDSLSIAIFGGWHTLHDVRKVIADDDHWVEGGKRYGWPRLSLTEAQREAVNVPQRRYALVGNEYIEHPHQQCIRIFHTYRSRKEPEARDGEGVKG